MARQVTISDRFPFAGLFIVIAIALAVPLTVWSLSNVPTQTNQQAATLVCSGGPFVKLYDCKNYQCSSVTYCARKNPITNKWTVSSLNIGTYDEFNDKAESLQLVGFPAGYSVRFYDNEKWSGDYITTIVSSNNAYKTEGVPDLSIYWRVGLFNSFANKITSFKSL
jgi:hypothetical protein